jgi:tetratricopeptide (TPR) repeat protein
MSFRTHNRNFAWQSNFTLWTATIKTGPESATAYNNLAEAAYSLGKINEALSAAQKAVSLNPNDITNLYNLANLNSVQKNFSEAIRYYQSITILDPDNPQSYSDLANAYMNMGNYKLAAQNYRKALNRLPGNIYLEQQLKIATSLFLKTINLPNMP